MTQPKREVLKKYTVDGYIHCRIIAEEGPDPVELLREIDPKMLRILADFVDTKYPYDSNPEVQTDLRKWASMIEDYLAATGEE